MTDKNNNSGNNNSGSMNSGDRNSGYRNSGSMNSGDRNSGDMNSGYRNSGYRNSGSMNSGYRNSGYRNSGNNNSGSRNSGYRNSGSNNSGDMNSGSNNSGYRNSGSNNSGDMNSGDFNTNEPKMRMFNKDCGFTRTELSNQGRLPHSSEFYLTKWIRESDMTDEQKVNDPDFHVKEGTLITFSNEEAWANFWRDTSEENRQKYLDLPNFVADIFKEITGIDVNKPEEMVEIDGKKYSKSTLKEAMRLYVR